MSENRLPSLPNSPMTTAEMSLVFFDLSPDLQHRMMTNLCTKGNVPKSVRSYYTRGLVCAQRFQLPSFMEFLYYDMMLRVSEGEKRMKDFSTQFALELHRQTNRKEEEKPKI